MLFLMSPSHLFLPAKGHVMFPGMGRLGHLPRILLDPAAEHFLGPGEGRGRGDCEVRGEILIAVGSFGNEREHAPRDLRMSPQTIFSLENYI